MRGGGLHQPRARGRRSGGGGAGGGGERGRRNHYAGIHYASASVRPWCPLPRVDDPTLPQQLTSYIYNPRDNHHHHHHDNKMVAGDFRGHPHLYHHHHHLQLCPLRRRAAYSAVDQRHPGEEEEDLPHHYDYIADLDSLRYSSGGDPALGEGHEYTYCTCEHDCPDNGPPSSSAENGGYRVLQQFAFPRGQCLEGYLQEAEDLTRQHEVSKPFPRYAEDLSSHPGEGGTRRGQLPYQNVVGEGRDSDVLVTFSGGVPLQDSALPFPTTATSGIYAGYLPDSRTHPGYLPHSRTHPVHLADSRPQPGYLSDSVTPGYLPDSRDPGEAFNDLNRSQHEAASPLSSTSHSRNQLHTISSHFPGTLLDRPPVGGHPGSFPSGHRVGPVPRPFRDPWGGQDEESSHYNSLGTSSMTQAVSNVYEDYPQSSGKEMVPRGKSLALQPQFYMDLLQGGGTSSV
ncbi:hypothetical protein ACOMHN_033719 [Nucella lapillus]